MGEWPTDIRETTTKGDVSSNLPSRGSMLCTIISFISSSFTKFYSRSEGHRWTLQNPRTQNTRKADALNPSESILLGGAIVPLYSAWSISSTRTSNADEDSSRSHSSPSVSGTGIYGVMIICESGRLKSSGNMLSAFVFTRVGALEAKASSVRQRAAVHVACAYLSKEICEYQCADQVERRLTLPALDETNMPIIPTTRDVLTSLSPSQNWRANCWGAGSWGGRSGGN